jgi:hypothetical protein
MVPDQEHRGQALYVSSHSRDTRSCPLLSRCSGPLFGPIGSTTPTSSRCSGAVTTTTVTLPQSVHRDRAPRHHGRSRPGSDLDILPGAQQLDHAYGDASVHQASQLLPKEGGEPRRSDLAPLHVFTLRSAAQDAQQADQASGGRDHLRQGSGRLGSRWSVWEIAAPLVPLKGQKSNRPSTHHQHGLSSSRKIVGGPVDRVGTFNRHFRRRPIGSVMVCRLVMRAHGCQAPGCRSIVSPLSVR